MIQPTTPLISEMPQAAAPFISVLVPIYNAQDFLRECLDSLCAQTFTDFEAICINDGSTDDSRAIVEQYLEKDVRFVPLDKANSGYGASLNQGLEAARGSYIAILAADETREPDALEHLLDAITTHDAQVAKGNCLMYWAGPPEVNMHHDLVPHKQVDQLVDPQERHEIFHLAPSLWSALYRADFLRDNNIRFLESPGASYQDAAFNFKVWVCAKRVYFLKDEVIHYRQDNPGSSINSSGKVYCICDEFAEMDRYLDEYDLRSDWLSAVHAKMRNRSYLWNYERLDEDLQWEFLQRYAAEMTLELERGHLDWTLLDKWDRLELESILRSPNDYHAARLRSGRGKFGKIKRVLKIGGPVLLAQFIWSKLFR